MWEDAAANSVGAGGIDGIGIGAKGEPGVHIKKKKKKDKTENRLSGPGNNSKGDWEQRSKTASKARTQMWKALGKKLGRK